MARKHSRLPTGPGLADSLDGIFKRSRSSEFSLAVQSNWRYFAFFRLLQLSRSYWQVHCDQISGLLPDPDDPVASVYKAFGDVWGTPFWEWWFAKAQFQFGVRTIDNVTLISRLGKQDAEGVDPRSATEALNRYLKFDHARAGGPDTLILAVPISGDRRRTLRKVRDAIASAHGPTKDHVFPSPFKILPERIHKDTINAAIRACQARAIFHAEQLYVVGNRAQLDDNNMTSNASKDDTQYDMRRAMAQTTSRFINRGNRLSENAAAGVFPSLKVRTAIRTWTSEELPQLAKLLRDYASISDRALQGIPPKVRTSEARYAGWNRTIDFS